MKTKINFFSLLLFSFLSSAAFAEPELSLQGEGTYRWWGIKVYDAKLYVSPDFSGDALTSKPLALEIIYDIDIDKKDLVETTEEEWDELKISKTEQCKSRKQWAEKLLEIWPNLEQGDKLKFNVYQDGQSEFFYNNDSVGVIDDKNFAPCFLAIWLAEDTSASSLRRSLLNRS
ncbi:MAG: chalcone isomerase family protein [Gammaproteobacteria bacterium]|nr:chalcone isomerase family protein [Gammaproteobacteria bacterium]